MTAFRNMPERIQALVARLARLPRSDAGFMRERYTLVLTAVMFPAETAPDLADLPIDWYVPPTLDVGSRADGDPAWSRAVRVHILLQTYTERPTLSQIGMLVRSGRGIEMVEEQLVADRMSQIRTLTVIDPDQAQAWASEHAADAGHECGPVLFWMTPET